MRSTANSSHRYLAAKFALFVVWTILSSAHLLAQTASKWVEKGIEAQNSHEFLKATEYYRWSLKQDTSLIAIHGLAECEEILGNYKASAAWWKLAAKHPSAGREEFYGYGRILLSISRPDEAATWFAKYYAADPDALGAAAYKDVQNWLPNMFRDSAMYALSRLRSNSKYADFGATWLNNGILFSSNRPTDVGVVHTSAADGLPLLDMYFAEFDAEKGFGKANSVAELNTRYHDGPAFYSEKQQALYITRAVPAKSAATTKGGLDPLAIFIYKMVDGKWVENGQVPSGDYSMAHPAFSPDGNWLYFSSDMEGGLGGRDIWKMKNADGNWGTPINAGPNINTAGNESYPAFQMDGSLFFASNGLPGLGGLDVFMARPDGQGGFNRPINPGAPVNSTKDDFNFLPKGDGSEGVLSSNRNQGMGDDIWYYKRTQPSFECKPQEENVYCYRFWETGSIDMDTLPLYYAWDMGDGTYLKGLEIYHCFDGPGDYLVELNLIDSISGYVFLNEATYQMKIRDHAQPFITGPDTIKVFENAIFNGEKSNLPDCNIEKYFWDFGDGTLGNGASVTHMWRKAGTYEIQLGVTGGTTGSSESCKSCVTKKVLVMEAKAMKRIQDSTARAREANPFSNPQIDIKSQSREIDSAGKAVRDIRDSSGVLFKVQLTETKKEIPLTDPIFTKLKHKQQIQVLKGDSAFKYTYGSSNTRDKIYPYYEEARDKGFGDALVVAFKNDIAISGNDSTYTLKIPINIEGDKVTIFSGKVRDSQGNPIMAVLTVEDLMNNVEVIRVKTGESGAFSLKLPDGRIYGYYLDSEGYFPYSDYLDLRSSGQTVKKEVVIEETLTMQSIKEIMSKGSTVRMNNIFFDYDKADLKPESNFELTLIVGMLKDHPEIRLEILGHTDSEGEASYNHELSKYRAEAVASYLKKAGYADRVIRTIGYGELLPIADNETPTGRQLNRRVELRLMKK